MRSVQRNVRGRLKMRGLVSQASRNYIAGPHNVVEQILYRVQPAEKRVDMLLGLFHRLLKLQNLLWKFTTLSYVFYNVADYAV